MRPAIRTLSRLAVAIAALTVIAFGFWLESKAPIPPSLVVGEQRR